MSEHHGDTEFLKHCLRYDNSLERDRRLKHLVLLQHELRIFRRALYMVLLLIVPALPALLFSNLFLQNLSETTQRTIVNLLVAVNLGLIVSLFTFLGLRLRLRGKLHREREQCRQFLKKFLAERCGPEAPAGQSNS
jgi:hypothetical protein